MSEIALRIGDRLSLEGLIKGRVTNVAIVSDDLARRAYVLVVMTTETTLTIEMTDVVWVGFPVSFHLGEKICRKDSL